VTGGRRPPPRGGQTKDAVAVAAAAPAATNKAKDGDAAGAAAARLARATAAGAALRRLAAGSPPPVTLRTVYVRGVARESRTWRLRELLSGATGLPKRAVVDVDRAGDLAEVRLLAQHADAFEAAVALSPAAATLTLVRDVDPLSPSLLGAPRRRGLSAEAAIETARAFFVARRRAKLSSLDARVGMPPAHRDALRPLLHRELAPHVRQLAAGGGAVGGRVALPAAAAAGAAAQRGGAARRGADGARLVPPKRGAAAAAVDADRLGDENIQPAASTPASVSALQSEISVLPPTPPTFSAAAEGDAAAAENNRADGDGVDIGSGIGKRVVTTTVTDPPPGSDRAWPRPTEIFAVSASPGGCRTPPTSSRLGTDPPTPSARAARHSLAAARHMAAAGGVVYADASEGPAAPLPPLADVVAAAVGRAPGGAVGALSLAVAMFRLADGAVAEAADAAAPPRRLAPAAAAARADVAEARGVRIAASAAATADADLAVSSPALPRPPPSPSSKGRLAAESEVALGTAQGLRRAAARIVASHSAPVAVARRLRAAALAGVARRARGAAARAVAAAAAADAAAAASVGLPPDAGRDICGSVGVPLLLAPAAGARAPPPTPTAQRPVRLPDGSALGHRSACAAAARPVGIAGRTRGAWLRAAAVAPPLVPGAAAELDAAVSPAAAHAAAGGPGVRRVSRDSLVAGGVPAAPQPDGWRAVSALHATCDDLSRASVAPSPPGASTVAPGAAPSAGTPAPTPPVCDDTAK